MATRPFLLESLEDRCVPVTWGNPWPDATHLTLSFVPDGTPIGAQSSNLFQTFDALAPRVVWQREILRAFQVWGAQAGISIGIVSDGGQALGTPGRIQGDPRFGDIRISAGNYSSEVLAFTSPFDATAGTWAGDLRINSPMWNSASWQSRFDLYTAMLQEAGHALGIGNSNDPDSVMYELYGGPRLGLSGGDITAIQTLYGPRQADSNEGRSGNESRGTATTVDLITGSDGLLALGAEGDLTTRTDRDVYRFRAPTLTGDLLVTLERAGLSMVTPRVTVFDSLGRVVATAESTDPMGGNLVLELNNVRPLGQYYLEIEGAGSATSPFRTGAYRLTVQSLPGLNQFLDSLTGSLQSLGAALLNNDLHTNDTILTASLLPGGLFAPTSRFDHAFRASISDTRDVDYYRIQAPAQAVGDNVLTVMAWSVGSSQLLPAVSVKDALGNPVAAEVLVNEGGSMTIQVVGVKAGATYYVKMDAAVSSGPGAVGNYFLGADFGSKATRLTTFANTQLDAAQTQSSGQMQVRRTGLFHFVLSADSAGSAGVEMTITNAAGVVVGRIQAWGEATTSITLTLSPDQYTITFRALSASGSQQTPVRFRLKGILLSDPIGPQGSDPTGEPSGSGGSSGGSPGTPWNQYNYWYEWSYGSQTTYGGPGSSGGSGGGFGA